MIVATWRVLIVGDVLSHQFAIAGVFSCMGFSDGHVVAVVAGGFCRLAFAFGNQIPLGHGCEPDSAFVARGLGYHHLVVFGVAVLDDDQDNCLWCRLSGCFL